jgi:uncharacterized protein YlxW (UPF0749 family)
MPWERYCILLKRSLQYNYGIITYLNSTNLICTFSFLVSKVQVVLVVDNQFLKGRQVIVRESKGILFVTFVLLGMVLAMQSRTILLAKQQNVVGQTSVQSLSAELEHEKNEGLRLQEELHKLEEREAEIMRQISNEGNPMINELLNKRHLLQTINGFTDVEGSGVIITLDDAPARNEMDPSQLIIHDSDIINILNELRAAGAQAFAINDERIIATSKQLCAGPTILINRNRYPVPYVVKAIGDPDELFNALEQSEVVTIMRIYDIQVSIRKESDIVIPRYRAYKNTESMISGLEVVEK